MIRENNPVIFDNYPDPDVIRAGSEHCMASTDFSMNFLNEKRWEDGHAPIL